MTEGLEVLVQLVIAEMTTDPAHHSRQGIIVHVRAARKLIYVYTQ